MSVLAQARTGGRALAAGRVARRRGLLRARCQIGQLQPGRALLDPAHRFQTHSPGEGVKGRQPPGLSSSRTSERWRHHDRRGSALQVIVVHGRRATRGTGGRRGITIVGPGSARDRGAERVRDTPYRRAVATPRSLRGGSGPVARVPGEATGSERPRLTPDSRQPPGCSFLRRRTASEEGPAGRGPAPEGAVSAEIPPYAALATPGQENRGPKDGG